MAKGRIWTSEEDEYLIEKWGNSSVKNIAKRLKRSIQSVKLRAFRLELGAFHSAGDLLLVKELIETLGYKHIEKVVKRFIEYDFPVKYVEFETKEYKKINIEDFWKWAENNKDIINFAFFEKNSLGKEPKWVDEKRKVDKSNYAKRKKKWTKEQEKLLVSKAKSGQYTLDTLADDFGRSEQSIRRKLTSLGEDIVLKPRKMVKYTKEEEQKILDMKNKGYNFYIIAKELNRSEAGIKDKYNRLVS